MPLMKNAVLLAAAAFVTGCGGPARLPDGASYIPADAALVLAFDVPEIQRTDLYRELKERGGAVGLNRLNFYKFSSALGLDPTKDIRWLTFIGRAREGEGPPIGDMSAVVTGSFDGAKLRRTLKDSGMPAERHGEVEVFQMVIVEGRCRFCIAVLDDTTAAFGDGEALRAIAESRSDRAKALSSNADARRLLGRIDPRAAVWGFASGKDLSAPIAGLIGRIRGTSAESPALSSITDLSFFVLTRESITLAMDALAASKEDALLVADVLEGAGAVGKIALKQAKPDAADLLSTFKVEVDDELIRASASVPSQRLLALAREGAGGFFSGGFERFKNQAGGTDGGPENAAPSAPAAPPPER